MVLMWQGGCLQAVPALCLFLRVCPFGMDKMQWASHVALFLIRAWVTAAPRTHFQPWKLMYVHTTARVLGLCQFKAVLTTVLTLAGVKRPGRFKVTNKARTGARNSVDGKGGDGKVATGEKAAVVDIEAGNGADLPGVDIQGGNGVDGVTQQRRGSGARGAAGAVGEGVSRADHDSIEVCS